MKHKTEKKDLGVSHLHKELKKLPTMSQKKKKEERKKERRGEKERKESWIVAEAAVS